jgi:hypothetical protein
MKINWKNRILELYRYNEPKLFVYAQMITEAYESDETRTEPLCSNEEELKMEQDLKRILKD